ncbi:MAG: alpha/beta hydrolase [Myxococcota bacterium]
MPERPPNESDLESAWFGDEGVGPTWVLLHEGLGSVSTWRDFPDRLAKTLGRRVFVYSRPGYGASPPVSLPRSARYMHEAAGEIDQILRGHGIEDVVLVGHSDGASIATLYAGRKEGAPPGLRALVGIAPHYFVESVALTSIRAAGEAYSQGSLRARLARHHGHNLDVAFFGWHDAWLSPEFRAWDIREALPRIVVPSLIIQGDSDEYGTLEQVRTAERLSGGPVATVIVEGCGHAPHRAKPEALLNALQAFRDKMAL